MKGTTGPKGVQGGMKMKHKVNLEQYRVVEEQDGVRGGADKGEQDRLRKARGGK